MADKQSSEEPVHSDEYKRSHPHILPQSAIIRGYKDYDKWITSRDRAAKNHRQRTKEKVINHYGKICACCGESNIVFLTISHPNKDGAEHRNKITGDNRRGGYGFYAKLVRDNFITPYKIIVECYNCNCGARSNNGICPHKQEILNIIGR